MDEAHCHLAPGQHIAALIMNALTEGVALYHMDDFFEQTDPDMIFTATDSTDEVTPACLADHNLRSVIEKLVGADPRRILMAVFQEAMARVDIDTNVLHGDVTTFSLQGTYEPDAESAAEEWLDDHDDDLSTIDCSVTETERKKSRDKPGRPPKDWEPYETVYQVEASQTRDGEAIADYKAKESC